MAARPNVLLNGKKRGFRLRASDFGATQSHQRSPGAAHGHLTMPYPAGPYPLCPFGTSSRPLLTFGHFPPPGGIGPLTGGVGPGPPIFYGGFIKEARNALSAREKTRMPFLAPPAAQPLAALPPYGCGVPLAGAAAPCWLNGLALLQEASRLTSGPRVAVPFDGETYRLSRRGRCPHRPAK